MQLRETNVTKMLSTMEMPEGNPLAGQLQLWGEFHPFI
jgi:hypothetical protein